jgi:hypothetical protein
MFLTVSTACKRHSGQSAFNSSLLGDSMAWQTTTLYLEPPVYDPAAIARQITSEAVAHKEEADRRDHQEYLEDLAATRQADRSAASKRGWAERRERAQKSC